MAWLAGSPMGTLEKSKDLSRSGFSRGVPSIVQNSTPRMVSQGRIRR
jgi:hypothetical protein